MKHGERSASNSAPLFCPACRRQYQAGEAALCAFCGETLIEKGYCPVCERHLPQPRGTFCPKHDLELGELPREEPFPTSPMTVGVGWAPVRFFADETALAAARIRLEAEGIPTYLEGERMGSSSMYWVATGGVRLLVPAAQISDARVILDQVWSAPTAEDEL
jgi:hypothetical protein